MTDKESSDVLLIRRLMAIEVEPERIDNMRISGACHSARQRLAEMAVEICALRNVATIDRDKLAATICGHISCDQNCGDSRDNYRRVCERITDAVMAMIGGGVR